MQNEPLSQPDRALIPPITLVEEEPDFRADPLPDLPILLSTRLQLELLLQEPVLDLRTASEIILQDVGATLQILRLVGEQYGGSDERPVRIEDCLASLETKVWFEAVSALTLVQNSRASSVWQHAKRIGFYAEQLASQEEGLRPGEGQLVGLLHEIGKLPELLGWQSLELAASERSSVGTLLAEHWHLPNCVLVAARDKQAESVQSASQWAAILQAAHACVQREEAQGSLRCEASESCA